MKKQIKKIRKSMRYFGIAMTYGIFMFMNEVNAVAQVNLDSVFENGTKEIQNIGGKVLNFITMIVGLAAGVLLAVNFMKRKDGEQNSNEAIVGWLKGLVYTFVGLIGLKGIFRFTTA